MTTMMTPKVDRIRKRTTPPAWVSWRPAWSLRLRGCSGVETAYYPTAASAGDARRRLVKHLSAGGWDGTETLWHVARGTT